MQYTLGCSFTKWHWPTWADWLEQYNGPVTNWGFPGYQNQLINWIIIDRLHRLNKEDHVYIMWTENNRIPQWYDNNWVEQNDCADFFPDKTLWFGQKEYLGLYRTHPEHLFSQTHNIITTFKTILDTQYLLEKADIKYTMMFMQNPWNDVRPEYQGKKFITHWNNNIGLSDKDKDLAHKILELDVVKSMLKLINWKNFVEKVDIVDPESYNGLWEYYLSKKELVLLKHSIDNHPNILAQHDYLVEKILKQELTLSKYRESAHKLALDNTNMEIPKWSNEDFIGSVDKNFINKEKYKLN